MSEPDYETVPLVKTLDNVDPMIQGAVAALLNLDLHLLDAVQGDQLCHMRTMLVVHVARKINSYLTEEGQLEEAKGLAAEWRRLAAQKKMEDEAFIEDYSALVRTCCKVIGECNMEITRLCFDTTRDVTWVFMPMGISTYFCDQGHVENKAEKQAHIQQLCIEEFEEIVASWGPSNTFVGQLQQALQLMHNRIANSGKDIPVLNFFIATVMVELIDFMDGSARAVAVRRMEIKPDNDTVTLNKILLLYFRHNKETGRIKPTQLLGL